MDTRKVPGARPTETTTGTLVIDTRQPPEPAPAASLPAGVEVSELELDDEEFSSTFGPGTSQFDELGAPGDDDPWSAILRID